MITRTLSSRLLLAAVLALPVTSAGCGRTACFTWSTLEGACPARSDALSFFTNPRCPGQITSVESEPVADAEGKLCCYQVTERAQTDESLCQGFGGSTSTGQGFGGNGSSAFAASSGVGQGGFGGSTTGQDGGTSCVRCGEEIGNTTPALFCDGSAALFNNLINCACSGACSATCVDTFCPGNPASNDCASCIADVSLGCGNQLNACANDL
jgi:hypothetical protein